jgi:hypothetical protein
MEERRHVRFVTPDSPHVIREMGDDIGEEYAEIVVDVGIMRILGFERLLVLRIFWEAKFRPFTVGNRS